MRSRAIDDVCAPTWVNAMIDSGIPAEYGDVLRALTATIAADRGSRPNGDVLTVTGAKPTSFTEFAAGTDAA